MKNYEKLTDIVLSMKRIAERLEAIWNKVDPTTCDVVCEPLPMIHLPCDSCEEKEDDNETD